MQCDLEIFAILVVFLFLSQSCQEKQNKITKFSGEKSAVEKADLMFEAIGGKDAWCQLRSLYIKAEHTEPKMDIPYTSEIWRSIDQFELVIEQQNDSFHVKAVLKEEGGTIKYLDKRDTFRNLTYNQLGEWKFNHNHNVYVLLHELACTPEKYKVEIDDEEKLVFYQDTNFLTSFGLDDQFRPHLFYQPQPDGTVSGSLFNRWGTHDGLVHSAGGHPLDSNFMYQTEIWTPSQKSLNDSFGKQIFDFE